MLYSSTELLELKELLSKKSVRFGNFQLSSGQHSDVYVDAKLTTCSARAIPLIGRAFISKMNARGWYPAAAGGLTMGADPIALAVARESMDVAEHPIDAFIVRKEPKQHGMRRYVEGIEETQGLSVVIIDDVCTTGASTATAIENAQRSGMLVLGSICLVDREMGASDLIASRFGLNLESVFTISELRSYHYENEAVGKSVGAGL